MTTTHFSGPMVVYGKLLATNTVPETNENAGPSAFYQGLGMPDTRFTLNKDKAVPGAFRGFAHSVEICSVDAVPQTLATNNIAAAQAVGAAGNLTLVTNTSAKAVCNNVPIVPANSTTGAAVNVLALDPGFQTVNVNGTATVTIAAGTANRFPVGGWIWIGGTSGGAGTFTRVTANAGLSTTTTITISPAVANTNAAAPCATTNLLSPYMNVAGQAPTGVFPWIAAGALSYFDPTQGLARCVQAVSTGAGDTTQTLTVRGYDVYLNPMTEILTLTGTTPVVGGKAFKYIASIAVSAATAGNVSVGTTDTFGMALRSDLFEYQRIFMAQAAITAATGWTAGDQATATGTTGDVRGRYAVQTASNGTRRLTIFQQIPAWNMVNTTPNTANVSTNTAPMFGVTQFSS
jgi:hypothetical protein